MDQPDLEKLIRSSWVNERALMQQLLPQKVQRAREKAFETGQSYGPVPAAILSADLLPELRTFAGKLSDHAEAVFVAHKTFPNDRQKQSLISDYRRLLTDIKDDALNRINKLKPAHSAHLIDHSFTNYGIACSQAATAFELVLASLKPAEPPIVIFRPEPGRSTILSHL